MKLLQPICLIAMTITANELKAQGVAINNGGTPAHSSAMLDVSATNKGMLAPRMTMTQRNAISSPATGLLIFQTDATPGFYYYNGTAWVAVSGGASGGYWDPSGTADIHNNNSGNVGIGTTTPLAKLHVSDSNVVFNAIGYTTATTPGNPPISGAGRRMMWYADKAAFRAGGVNGTQWDAANIGNYSFAAGNNSTASGENSTAIGLNNDASGETSTAMGVNATASGVNTTAIGYYSNATGDYSAVLGRGTALGMNSIAIGGWAEGNESVALANGVTTGHGSLAMGTGATATGDVAIAFGSTVASGEYSTSMGFNTSSSGSRATAMGNSTTASGLNATAMGLNTVASGETSTAMGVNATASGVNTTAIGYYSNATGDYSAVLGRGTALGMNSIAIGGWAEANESVALANGVTTGYGSIAMGSGATASGDVAIAFGSTVASGSNSTSMGNNVGTNNHMGSFAIGDNSPSTFSGSFTFTNNDADHQMMMRFAGGYKLYSDADATVGTQLAPGGSSWSTISDVRKKENFVPVNGEEFLNKIAKFSLTSWNYKGQNPKEYRHYGPMAQDFYAAFGKDSYGNVGNDTTISQADMEGVSFVAIQALERRTREQQKQIEALTKENMELKAASKQIADLSARLEAMEATINNNKGLTTK